MEKLAEITRTNAVLCNDHDLPDLDRFEYDSSFATHNLAPAMDPPPYYLSDGPIPPPYSLQPAEAEIQLSLMPSTATWHYHTKHMKINLETGRWGLQYPCYGLNGNVKGSMSFSGSLNSIERVTISVSEQPNSFCIHISVSSKYWFPLLDQVQFPLSCRVRSCSMRLVPRTLQNGRETIPFQ